MFKKILFLCLLPAYFASCVPQKDFMVTNEFVDSKVAKKKNTGKNYTYDTVLTDEDKKYFAKKLDVQETEILNEKLYNFIKFCLKDKPIVFVEVVFESIKSFLIVFCNSFCSKIFLYISNFSSD